MGPGKATEQAGTVTPPTPVAREATRKSREESRALIIAATTELVKERSYAELSVGEIMERAGRERTLFYRHFNGIPDLLVQASTEAAAQLYAALVELGKARQEADFDSVAVSIEATAQVYVHHGPLLRTIAEVGAADHNILEQGNALRAQFNTMVAEMLADLPPLKENPPADFEESARALNLMNEMYLRDAFGREPRVSVEVAVETLTEIWMAFINRRAND
jgi:AcrR family transcriptional regulator